MLPDPLLHAPVALVALLIDLATGERIFFLHPVPLMGRLTVSLEGKIRAHVSSRRLRLGGILLPLLVCGLFGVGSWALLVLAEKAGGRLLRQGLEVFWSVQLLASRSLYDHVRKVGEMLSAGDLAGARAALSRIVGRDTEGLGEDGIARGALESLWENTNDALVAPLFYLLVLGVPGLMVYKAASTLDSMVGYKNERYRDLGWASARIDDLFAYIPARITFFLMFLFLLPFVSPGREGQGRLAGPDSVLSTALRYRRAHPSPNSGYPIAAFSALRGVRLGGGAFYFGRWVEKPVIGAGPDPGREDLEAGLNLYRMFVFSLVILLALLVALPRVLG
ncbi:MAG: adenosylcobinamide-phosphate synthase CbiB [Nitrospirae bacterium]|nr:adenosylcobinamide-phosphate synthase CbiB [Nitrospirota bacterium]MCL5284499.1 adenosylcobinamide-phosphate synthase CbiB [Nitrospirota bacterium]